MIKLLLTLSLSLTLYALSDTNETLEITNLEDDKLFHAQREDGMSLYAAINRAIKHSNKLDASYQVVIQDKQKVKEVQAGHLPVVNLSGDTGYELRQFSLDENAPNVNTPITSASDYTKVDLYLTIKKTYGLVAV